MAFLDRIKRAIAGSGRSSDQVIPGGAGTTSTDVGIGQIQAVERQEFPPEEFASGENEESES
jgi:hypothetical protein